MRMSAQFAERIVDALEEHWMDDAECLCRTLKDIPEIKAELARRTALRKLRPSLKVA